MFESISQRFQDIGRRLFSAGQLTEKNIEEGIREIRLALLEADVNYQVVKKFIERVKQKAVGANLIKSIKPGEQLLKIVYEELVELMGPEDTSIVFAEKGPTVIMMAGLQGSGKTTTCGKLAKRLIDEGKSPLLVAADLQRPGAIEQLQKIGGDLDVPVFSEPKSSPPKICAKAISHATGKGCDVVILDTAGRLHIDDELMSELNDIKKKTKPHNVFLVTNAMTGQDAATSAKSFNELLRLDGVILTMMEGDTRGGAAISIREVAGCPIKFIGVGEKPTDSEEFDPEGTAGRILGRGDLKGLLKKISGAIEEEEALEMQKKLEEGKFSLQDFLGQLRMMKRIGGVGNLMGMLPSNMLPDGAQDQIQSDEAEQMIRRTEAIILSMTPDERNKPEMLNGSRKRRVAQGSGNSVEDVNQFLNQFFQMRKMMSNMGAMGNLMGKMGNIMGGGGGGAMPSMAGMSGMGPGGGKKRSKRKKKPRRKK